MKRKDVIAAVANNPNLIVRQRTWFSYEGLRWNPKEGMWLDEINLGYKDLSSFSDDGWEVIQTSKLEL